MPAMGGQGGKYVPPPKAPSRPPPMLSGSNLRSGPSTVAPPASASPPAARAITAALQRVAGTAHQAQMPGGRASAAIKEAQIASNYRAIFGHLGNAFNQISPQQLLSGGGAYSGEGQRFPSLNSLPPQIQVPIVRDALRQDGLLSQGWNKGLATLYKTLGPQDRANIQEMDRALQFQHQQPLQMQHPQLPQSGPQGGMFLPPNGPDRMGANDSQAPQYLLPLAARPGGHAPLSRLIPPALNRHPYRLV
jgi:hypothetical protein